MDLSELGQAEVWIGAFNLGFARLGVDPLGSLAVALDLVVLEELLVAHDLAGGQEVLDLLELQSVALDGRRVVALLVPDTSPD